MSNLDLDPKRILTIRDLASVGVVDDGSPLVDLRTEVPEVDGLYAKLDMLPYTGEAMLVRRELTSLLRQVQTQLNVQHPQLRLRVQYAYRHIDIQNAYYDKRFAENSRLYPQSSVEELPELTHLPVAYTPVSGHPTGGAVDVTIIDEEGVSLDMGTAIADYTIPEKCYTYSDQITETQRENRLLLNKLMTSVGFAPFNGEWWHFSYGDREWAKFYEKPDAMFAQVAYRQ